MSDPKRLLAYYRAFVESAFGLEARATDDDRALVFHDEDGLVYALRNTASYDAGLIDITVCVSSTDDAGINKAACRSVVQAVPCLRAWVDDGDIILNAQSIAAGAHLTPRPEVLREVLPRLIDLLRYAATRVKQDTTLAGIARASG